MRVQIRKNINMPELAEIKITADFINTYSKNRTFTKMYDVEKGNNPIESNLIYDFNLNAITNGKELKLNKDKLIKLNKEKL